MKMNDSILSLPPYLSTSWKNIVSLHVEVRGIELILIVNLTTGSHVEVPHLDRSVIEEIFAMHAHVLEQEQKAPKSTPDFLLPFRMGLGNLGTLDKLGESLGSVLQHNPDQANQPELPKEIIDRIASVAKTLNIEDVEMVPKPEPHCNCMFCQIARSIHTSLGGTSPAEEEVVSDEELRFRNWDITQAGEKLYVVSNPIDTKEYYNVFLGEPIGCTCGHAQCEHIQAVLKT
jgi:hypothetical protein